MTPQPSASQRVAGQAPWSVLAKIATLVGTLGVSVIAARQLGSHDFGVWSLARNMVTFGVLAASFGLDRALLRFVPELESLGSGSGIRRLFFGVVAAQTALLAVASAVLLALAPVWRKLFMPEIGPLLPLICLVTAAFTLKESLYQLFFALAQARALTVATTITGFGWLGLTWWWLGEGGGTRGALLAQAAALVVAILYLIPSLRRLLDIEGPSGAGLSGRRVASYAATQVGSSLVNLVVQRQSEIYFLAAVTTPAVVGFYDLGYSLPQLGLELIPLSLYAVVLSAITASYHREPHRLGVLVGWFYKLLAAVTVPFGLLGVAWADRLVVLLYGREMAPAGALAQLFSLIHLLSFVSLPVGVALNVVEKAHRTLSFGVLQVAVNLGLDLLLIPRFKVAGAVAAVVLTFLLVTPVTIRYAVRLTGPLEFPWRWMGRLVLALSPGLLPALARPWLTGWPGTVGGILASVLLMAAGFRFGGLIGPEERLRINQASFPGKNRLVKVLVG